MKITRAIILLSINSSSAIESTEHPKGLGVGSSINDCDAYCRFAYKYPQNQAACVRELVNLGTDCSRGMSFLQEDSASSETAMSEIEESKGPKVHTSIDDCDAYCRNSYKNPYNQATCVRVLESIGIDCSRGMNYIQEDDASSETAMKENKKSKGPSPHFRVSVSDSSDERSDSNLRGSAIHLANFAVEQSTCAEPGSGCRLFSDDCCTGRCLPRTVLSREGVCVSDKDDDYFDDWFVGVASEKFVKENESQCRNRGAECRFDSDCCNGPCVDINRRLSICDT